MTYQLFLKFLIYSLAIWRLTYLIARDNGPFHIFDWFRFKIGIQVFEDEHGNSLGKSYKNQFAELVDCMYCLSFWVTILFIPGLVLTNPAVIFTYDLLAMGLALWGVSTLLVKVGFE